MSTGRYLSPILPQKDGNGSFGVAWVDDAKDGFRSLLENRLDAESGWLQARRDAIDFDKLNPLCSVPRKVGTYSRGFRSDKYGVFGFGQGTSQGSSRDSRTVDV